MRDFAILVCGAGRCGSSMVMQMLSAGGVPCAGAFPSFEPDESGHIPLKQDWLLTLRGRAAKVLDPHRGLRSSPVPLRVIWLNRDPKQQARSQAKFFREFLGESLPRNATRKLAASYSADKAAAMAIFRRLNAPVMELHFERIIDMPRTAAGMISDFICGFDEASAAACVLRRDAACAPDMGIELSLIAEAEPNTTTHSE